MRINNVNGLHLTGSDRRGIFRKCRRLAKKLDLPLSIYATSPAYQDIYGLTMVTCFDVWRSHPAGEWMVATGSAHPDHVTVI